MTCLQLGGACNETFEANTFEEIAELSKAHGMKMYKLGDQAHITAMQKMTELMHNPADMKAWYADRKREFEAL